MSRIPLRSLAIALVAGALGFLLQATASGGFAQIWPGRMVSLPVAILLGPWWGVLAAVITAWPSATHWSLLAICTLEALTIGLATRRGYSALIAGGLFWIA